MKTEDFFEEEDFFTVFRFLHDRIHKYPDRQITLGEAMNINAKAFDICQERQIEIKTDKSKYLGLINAYPESILIEVTQEKN